MSMRISGNSLTESAWQLYQKNQTYGTQQTTFNDLLRSATGDVRNAADPKAQIWSDYQAWKSQQPKRVLPDSKGVTEENLTYLLEHFTEDKRTGELSLFQRMEVVDTMREMGILTHEEMMIAFGMSEPCLIYGGEVDGPPECWYGGLIGDDQMNEWSDVLHRLPLSKMNNMNNLFRILDIQLRGNRAEGTAAEIREVMERVSPGFGTSFTESAYPLYQNHQPSPQAAAYGNPLINARNLDELFEILDRLLRDDTEDDIGDDLQEAFDRVEQAVLKQAVLQ